MPNVVRIRRTNTPAHKPARHDLEMAELGVNIPDGRLYTADATGNAVDLTGVKEGDSPEFGPVVRNYENGGHRINNIYGFYESGNNNDGALVFYLPVAYTSTMMLLDITGTHYQASYGMWKCRFYGYNYGPSNADHYWTALSAELTGLPRFSDVRVGYDPVKEVVVVVLGNTSSNWRYPTISIDMIAQRGMVEEWLSGWDHEFVTDQTVLDSFDLRNVNTTQPHQVSGYLKTESDPTVPSHVKSISTGNIANWNAAYGWGDHAQAGYASQAALTSGLSGKANTNHNHDSRYYTQSEINDLLANLDPDIDLTDYLTEQDAEQTYGKLDGGNTWNGNQSFGGSVSLQQYNIKDVNTIELSSVSSSSGDDTDPITISPPVRFTRNITAPNLPAINDSGISSDDLWSAEKIISEIANSGGGGATSLDDLSDVYLLDPQPYQILVSDDYGGWVNQSQVHLTMVPNLPASKINSGTFVQARIPTLAKSKISTSGTWPVADIPQLPISRITDLQDILDNIGGGGGGHSHDFNTPIEASEVAFSEDVKIRRHVADNGWGSPVDTIEIGGTGSGRTGYNIQWQSAYGVDVNHLFNGQARFLHQVLFGSSPSMNYINGNHIYFQQASFPRLNEIDDLGVNHQQFPTFDPNQIGRIYADAADGYTLKMSQG